MICDVHARLGKHVAQALQPLGEGGLRQFEEKVGGALAGAGIDLPAMKLHEGHQAIPGREAFGAEEKQMLQKMRQPRPSPRRVVTARCHTQRGRTALEPWLVTQHHIQAVGQREALSVSGVCGRHEGHPESCARRGVMLAD
ncbi:hypothetical protein ALQ20_200070 [Pseudomonas syringae pv. atrofaciens]|nr:hypothetical protein ALQ20_200070 [Pseudomonas syringae pv. atrofaciens]